MDRLPHYCPICAFLDWNLDGLVEMCWDYLDMVRHRNVCHYFTVMSTVMSTATLHNVYGSWARGGQCGQPGGSGCGGRGVTLTGAWGGPGGYSPGCGQG